MRPGAHESAREAPGAGADGVELPGPAWSAAQGALQCSKRVRESRDQHFSVALAIYRTPDLRAVMLRPKGTPKGARWAELPEPSRAKHLVGVATPVAILLCWAVRSRWSEDVPPFAVGMACAGSCLGSHEPSWCFMAVCVEPVCVQCSVLCHCAAVGSKAREWEVALPPKGRRPSRALRTAANSGPGN